MTEVDSIEECGEVKKKVELLLDPVIQKIHFRRLTLSRLTKKYIRPITHFIQTAIYKQ